MENNEDLMFENTNEPELNDIAPIENNVCISSNEYMERFSGADWFNEANNTTVMIIGLGGIGSHTALKIAKLGCNVILNDFDNVEAVNMSGQNFGVESIGENKANATRANLMRMGIDENKISVINTNILYAEEFPRADIYVLALDDIDTRRSFANIISNKFKYDDNGGKVDIIDGRLTAELLQVFHCRINNNNSFNKYKNSFFDKKDAMPTMCSFKQTFYMASMISDIIANIVVNILINEVSEFSVPIPSFIEYNSRLMDYKLEL